ncbi:hypothetical protein CFIMG_008580RA00001 [Ceratocystis fimbriata CBS 114723]|uniref:Non-homologous end-joining factor 1 n=1 Tax=Ceratocystis fimbriata CBS 114723 TaxID=1035309 RepID=A0A2C5WW48_9PEZI|nr:hypothetical protein CFIMG_008580RA00001 [Ceratocystis fimbriata CBS 114723]
MSVPGPWKVLPLRVGNGIPLLLTSFSFSDFSYTVYISDLSNVWVERLNRKQICMRGFQEDTSIDPSDGDNNMTAFLKSLTRAFDDAESDHHKTSITISPGGTTGFSGGSSSSEKEGFTLTVTCQLPEELTSKPLKWNMYLSKCASPEIASRLVLPLVEAQQEKTFQVDSLVSTIHQKDAIIIRLLDKLDAMDIPLENVFTIASTGKRKLTRQAAQERIKGLAPFNRKTWAEKVKIVMPKPTDVVALLEDTLDDVQLEKALVTLENAEEMEDWWMTITPGSGGPRTTPRRKHRTAFLSNHPQNDDTARDKLWNDSLRRFNDASCNSNDALSDSRSVPTRYQSTRNRPSYQLQTSQSRFKDRSQNDNSAAGSEDDCFESNRPETPPPEIKMDLPSSPIKPSPVKKFSGLGRIGGRAKAKAVITSDDDPTMSLDERSSPLRPPPVDQPQPPFHEAGKIGTGGTSSATREESALDRDETTSLPESEASPSLHRQKPVLLPSQTPMKKLGVIGGAAKASPKTVASNENKGKLGTIGGIKRPLGTSSSPSKATTPLARNDNADKPGVNGPVVPDTEAENQPVEPAKPIVQRKVGGRPLVKKRKF